MAGCDGIVVGGAWHFAGQLFERLPFGFRDEEGGEDTAQHEEGEDLHHVVEPGGVGGACGRALLAEGPEDALGDDGADFAGGGGDAVRGRPVAGGEAFTGYDERGRVGSCYEESVMVNLEHSDLTHQS